MQFCPIRRRMDRGSFTTIPFGATQANRISTNILPIKQAVEPTGKACKLLQRGRAIDPSLWVLGPDGVTREFASGEGLLSGLTEDQMEARRWARTAKTATSPVTNG
jgi:hypothetical protein